MSCYLQVGDHDARLDEVEAGAGFGSAAPEELLEQIASMQSSISSQGEKLEDNSKNNAVILRHVSWLYFHQLDAIAYRKLNELTEGTNEIKEDLAGVKKSTQSNTASITNLGPVLRLCTCSLTSGVGRGGIGSSGIQNDNDRGNDRLWAEHAI